MGVSRSPVLCPRLVGSHRRLPALPSRRPVNGPAGIDLHGAARFDQKLGEDRKSREATACHAQLRVDVAVPEVQVPIPMDEPWVVACADSQQRPRLAEDMEFERTRGCVMPVVIHPLFDRFGGVHVVGAPPGERLKGPRSGAGVDGQGHVEDRMKSRAGYTGEGVDRIPTGG